MDNVRRRALKQLFLPAFALPLLLPFQASGQSGPPPLHGARRSFTQIIPPLPAPLTPMYTAKGGVTNLRKYRGKVVLLNFWATWCASCLHELPALSRLQKKFGGDGLEVVTLNVEEISSDTVAQYFGRLGIDNLPHLQDPAARAPAAFNTRGLPWSFVIDRDGLERGYMIGRADWDSIEAQRLVSYYLK